MSTVYQVSKYTRSPATDSLLTKRKIMWVRCSTPLVLPGVPSWGIRPRGTNPEVLERRRKERKKKENGPGVLLLSQVGTPLLGECDREAPALRSAQKEGILKLYFKPPGEARGEGGERLYKRVG